MKLDVQIDGDLAASLGSEISAAEKAVTLGVTRTGEALEGAWRAQVTGAGLGRRLANAIRANRYPRSGARSARRRWCSAAPRRSSTPSTAAC